MADIRRTRIDHPAAWTARSLGGKEALVHRLSDEDISAIDKVLAATRHIAPQKVTRSEFDHPVLRPLFAELFELIQHGRGAVVIAGLDATKYSPEDMERIYWGFGTHWGIAETQSALGDRLGRVKFTPISPENPTNRAYRSNEELSLHTDTNEIMGLMCVQKAPVRGYSRLASALAIHNEILATRPELLEPLYEGFYYASREAASTAQPVTPYKVPVFCCVDGEVSCHVVVGFMRAAAEKLGRALPAELVEALAYFEEVGNRDDIALQFILEPGEMMIVNNYAILHARTSFEDSAEQKRSLLRLWLEVPNGRKVTDAYRQEALNYRRMAEAKLALSEIHHA